VFIVVIEWQIYLISYWLLSEFWPTHFVDCAQSYDYTPHVILTRFLSRNREGVNYYSKLLVFTAQCTLMQSAVLRSHDVRLSVRPSVTLVICRPNHIGWKSWKLLARAISPTPSLFAAKRRSTYSHANGEILESLEVA